MKGKIKLIIGFFFLYLGLISVLFVSQQNTFGSLFIGVSIAFLGYFLLIFSSFNKWNIQLMMAAAIALRFFALFAIPNLTDDYFRFYWDGWLNSIDVSPYLMTPNEVVEIIKGPNQILKEINSPNYYSIYPPVLQKIFHLAYILAKGQLEYFIYWAKVPIFLGEILTIILIPKILSKLNKGVEWSMWYYFNPLIVIELVGNLHYEAFAITGLSLGLYSLLLARPNWSAFGISFSIGVKLLPLIFVPFFLVYWKKWNTILFGLLLSLFLLDLMNTELIGHFFESFNLYFQKFEFNGGIYFFARELGIKLIGYNPIAYLGPGLQMMGTLIMATWLVKWLKKDKSIESGIEMLFFWMIIYLFASTTVHPWYLAIPIFLGTLSGYKFAAIWSWTIFLSYYHYNSDDYKEVFWVPILEYGIVWITMLLELKKRWPFSRSNAFPG